MEIKPAVFVPLCLLETSEGRVKTLLQQLAHGLQRSVEISLDLIER